MSGNRLYNTSENSLLEGWYTASSIIYERHLQETLTKIYGSSNSMSIHIFIMILAWSGKVLVTRALPHTKDRNSSIGTSTRYELDGPGIEFWWGWDFPHPPKTSLGPIRPPLQGVLRLTRGQSGRGMALTTHSNLAPSSNKMYSYTSAPPVGVRSLF